MRKQAFPLLFAVALILGAFSTSTASSAQTLAKKKSGPECFCTDKQGQRRELGDIVCLTVGGRSFRAKCVMAQNVPFWRDLSEACVLGQAPAPLSPANETIIALYK
ncbi:MAG: hypothetical protein AAF903_11630 [Pseudomonadota bacterium]